MKRFIFCLILISTLKSYSQFAPAAGEFGSTALYKDSSIIINWAVSCSIQRGFMNVAIPDSGYVYSGDSTLAIGKALENGVVSLGDGGIATCTFAFPIANGAGFDFAVFENSFTDTFLELAFVEVSSNGSDFFRFNSSSLTDTTNQLGPFDFIDPTKINNLAGKYRLGYGTPFDLQELAGIDSLNINRITHVRIIDVVGSMDSNYASRDNEGRKINDPWPTQFFTGGFDLDAIAVMYQDNPQLLDSKTNFEFSVYPNPCQQSKNITITGLEQSKNNIQIFDSFGRLIRTYSNTKSFESSLLPGNYFVKIQDSFHSETHQLIILP